MTNLPAKRHQWDLVDRAAIEDICDRTKRQIATAKTLESVQAKADEVEALLAAIRKWKPEFTPSVNAAYLFARKRLGELTPKEQGRRNDFSDTNEKLNQKEMNRRWENAALAEYWNHKELGPRLKSGTISLSKALQKIKVDRAIAKAVKIKDAARNKVTHAPFQSVMESIPQESVELIFADPPWDSESIDMYADLGALAARILVPGGSMLVYSSSQMLNRTIAMLSADGMRFQGMCYDVRCSGKYARLNRDGIIVRVMPLVWYIKGGARFGTADFVEDAVVTDSNQKTTHEWQQHEAVAEYYIRKLTSAKGVVFDPFCGGGTTARIAKLLGRQFITCDVDENAVTAAQERIDAVS